MSNYLVTGGAGFIGSRGVKNWCAADIASACSTI